VIGAPGSTGEIPAVSSFVSRPMTPARGFNGESVDATQYSAFSGPSLAGPPSQAAVAAGAAAEAAAGVRSATGEGLEGGQSALPRRRRTPATTGPNAGLPAEALAAAANPASGLFTPTTPPSEDDSNRQRPTGAAAIVRTPGGPAETSPTGIGGLRSLHNPDTGRAESPLTDPRFAERPGEGHHFDTPPAGFSGLPGLNRAGGSGRGGASPGEPSYQDPLTARTGEFRAEPNRNVSAAGQNGAGWGGEDLPTELAARAAAAAAYRPADPNAPMIGEDARPGFDDPTPIFDQISVWFTADPTGGIPTISADVGGDQVIDLREQEEQRPSSRWASLGDQRWLATNARAAAAPDTEGTTETGLPMRRPGANLLPSAATAAPPPVAGRPAPSEQPGGGGEQPTPDADLVRGRLGSYQRGLADARKARSQPAPAPAFDPVGASLFTANSEAGDDVGQHSGEQGGDQ
jgi:hypothetical protein